MHVFLYCPLLKSSHVFFHYQFKCCGVDDYKDVEAAPGWVRTYTINNQQVTFKAPYFCCKNIKTDTPIVDSGLFTSVDQTKCATDPTDDNSNFNMVRFILFMLLL